ncbi:hypothetical protein PTKU64_55160 [Paraburkholderia terrae]|uniref:Uncharacterized protein n=1 Tax=Paraburkholderia terrae TaxID=311230 RepID=A0ABN6JMA1_9BURK|nr:hypothetical protein PTKU64_55160 [Paraburkholderia terrae]
MNSNQDAVRCVSIGDCAPVSWLMTDRDVLAMFPEEAMHLHAPIRRKPKRLASAAISKITVGAWECTAHFFFGGDALLNEIIVIPLDQNPVGCFESWLMLLAAAHGRAGQQPSCYDLAVWHLPATTVRLQRIDATALGMPLVSIQYQRRT